MLGAAALPGLACAIADAMVFCQCQLQELHLHVWLWGDHHIVQYCCYCSNVLDGVIAGTTREKVQLEKEAAAEPVIFQLPTTRPRSLKFSPYYYCEHTHVC